MSLGDRETPDLLPPDRHSIVQRVATLGLAGIVALGLGAMHMAGEAQVSVRLCFASVGLVGFSGIVGGGMAVLMKVAANRSDQKDSDGTQSNSYLVLASVTLLGLVALFGFSAWGPDLLDQQLTVAFALLVATLSALAFLLALTLGAYFLDAMLHGTEAANGRERDR